MHYFDSTAIDGPVYLHIVGNKQNGEPLVLTSNPLTLNQELQTSLQRYFLSHFKQMEYYCFAHEVSLGLNEVYTYVAAIFDDVSSLEQQSKYIAQTLYRSSLHPNIKGGELYIAHFRNCLLDGERVDAVGIFKSENKTPFIKIVREGNSFELIQERGVNLDKLDKGCLVFNIQREKGFLISVVDNTNKGEAKYWMDEFLRVKRNNDDFAQTEHIFNLCKGFVAQIPGDVSKAEKAAMINRVMTGLSEDNVCLDELVTNAFGEVAAQDFKSYQEEYQETNNMKFDERITGVKEAVKRQSLSRLITLKLDSNFDVKILGGEEMIEQGYDDVKGMKYYKLYYREER